MKSCAPGPLSALAGLVVGVLLCLSSGAAHAQSGAAEISPRIVTAGTDGSERYTLTAALQVTGGGGVERLEINIVPEGGLGTLRPLRIDVGGDLEVQGNTLVATFNPLISSGTVNVFFEGGRIPADVGDSVRADVRMVLASDPNTRLPVSTRDDCGGIEFGLDCLSVLAGPAVGVTATPQRAPAGSDFPVEVTVQVADAEGQPIEGLGDLSLATSRGRFASTRNAAVTLDPTDMLGATSALLGSPNAGRATIEARYRGRAFGTTQTDFVGSGLAELSYQTTDGSSQVALGVQNSARVSAELTALVPPEVGFSPDDVQLVLFALPEGFVVSGGDPPACLGRPGVPAAQCDGDLVYAIGSLVPGRPQARRPVFEVNPSVAPGNYQLRAELREGENRISSVAELALDVLVIDEARSRVEIDPASIATGGVETATIRVFPLDADGAAVTARLNVTVSSDLGNFTGGTSCAALPGRRCVVAPQTGEGRYEVDIRSDEAGIPDVRVEVGGVPLSNIPPLTFEGTSKLRVVLSGVEVREVPAGETTPVSLSLHNDGDAVDRACVVVRARDPRIRVASGSVRLDDEPIPGGGSQTFVLELRRFERAAERALTFLLGADRGLGRGRYTTEIFMTLPAEGDNLCPEEHDPEDSNLATVVMAVEPFDLSQSFVTVNPAEVAADGESTSEVTVTLRDPDGDPVDIDETEQPLRIFLGLGPKLPFATTRVGPGRFQALVSSTRPGVATVLAEIEGRRIAFAFPAQVRFLDVAKALELELRADREVVRPGEAFRLEARVRRNDSMEILVPGDPSLATLGLRLPPELDVPGLDRDETGVVLPLSEAEEVPGEDPEAPSSERRLVIPVRLRPGRSLNNVRVSAVAQDHAGAAISPTRSVSLPVLPDPLTEESAVVGRVYEDRDGDGQRSEGEPGIEGARIVLENGLEVLTDAQGLYSLRALKPGRRLMKLDPRRLPVGATSSPAWRRLVYLTPGAFERVDFPVAVERRTRQATGPGWPIVKVTAQREEVPLRVQGSLRPLRLLVNGAPAAVPEPTVVTLSSEPVLVVRDGVLDPPLVLGLFDGGARAGGSLQRWSLTLDVGDGAERTMRGEGRPPAEVVWTGREHEGPLLSEGTLQVIARLSLYYDDGAIGRSAAIWAPAGGERRAPRGLPSEPQVRVDGQSIDVGMDHRFSAELDTRGTRISRDGGVDIERVEVQLERIDGLSWTLPLELPGARFDDLPTGLEIPLGGGAVGCRISALSPPESGAGRVGACDITGRVSADASILVDGRERKVDDDGRFFLPVPLSGGRNVFSVVVRSNRQMFRLVNLNIEVAGLDDAGKPLLRSAPAAPLEAALPPPSAPTNPQRSIPIRGQASPGAQVWVNGEAVEVDASGAYAGLLPPGTRGMTIVAEDAGGQIATLRHSLGAPDNSGFAVLLGELTLGWQRRASQAFMGRRQDEPGGLGAGKLYVDGRAAGYFELDLGAGFDLVGAADSGELDLSQSPSALWRREPRWLERRLDPDNQPLTDGDESETRLSALRYGPLYLKLSHEAGHLGVSAFQTQLGDAASGMSYRRGLYGAHGELRPAGGLRLRAFGATLDTRGARDELTANGGSVYYLSHRDIVQGSPRAEVQVRDRRSGFIERRYRLQAGRDFEVDPISGRLVLSQTLHQLAGSDRVIYDDDGGAERVLLVVDYEHRPERNSGDAAVGLDAEYGLGELLSFGAHGVYEDRARGYQLLGLRLRAGNESLGASASWQLSKGRPGTLARSQDGGLFFPGFEAGPLQGPVSEGGSGYALSLEAHGSYGRLQGRAAGLHVQKGFATSTLVGDRDLTRASLDGRLSLARDARIYTGLTMTRFRDGAQLTRGDSWQADLGYRQRFGHFTPQLELRYRRREQGADNGFETQLDEVILGAQLDLKLDPDDPGGLGGYLAYQHALWTRSDEALIRFQDTGTRGRAGVQLPLNEILSLRLEGSVGGRGQTAGVELRQRQATGETYGGLTLNPEGRGLVTLGGRSRAAPGTFIYSEQQWQGGRDEGDVKQVSGVTLEVMPGVNVGVSYERVDRRTDLIATHDATDMDLLLAQRQVRRQRDAGAFSLELRQTPVQLSSRFELRQDRGFGGGRRTRGGHTIHRVRTRLAPGLTARGRFIGTLMQDEESGDTVRRQIESGVGLALRPMPAPWLTLILRYAYLDELDEGESTRIGAETGFAGGETIPFDESERRDHVVTTEAALDLGGLIAPLVDPALRRWLGLTLSERVAVRWRRERFGDAAGFDARTLLWVNRLGWRFLERWELGGEYRQLRDDFSQLEEQGFLAELGRLFGDHLRLSGGWNFSELGSGLEPGEGLSHGAYLRVQALY